MPTDQPDLQRPGPGLQAGLRRRPHPADPPGALHLHPALHRQHHRADQPERAVPGGQPGRGHPGRSLHRLQAAGRPSVQHHLLRLQPEGEEQGEVSDCGHTSSHHWRDR